ncbi:MAG TPA: hypothetical protein VD966_07325 [Pyrinomonadaceae bacterium]|nr:hypothetical protein [Pyrinomonadaceae bacterium]
MDSEALAQRSELGVVDFQTSGSEKAQAHFLRGVAALHSFWYEEALEAFRESTKVDPEFMMGYWGEAMALNHPIWHEQDAEAARKVLAKIKGIEKLTPRERAYLDAVRVLYGEGDKLARDKAYSAAMEKIHRDYPDDLEAASFYALSLLGLVRPGDKGFVRQMRAGAVALDVYQKNPDHPGAAHYVIHAFDDPEHAILALPAARRYAEIAPEAHHARHMPSHIFIQLGMWPEAAASNESAWAVSDAWVKRKSLPISLRDYHSLSWLLYVYLQQGRQEKAAELLSQMQKDIEQSAAVRQRGYASMAAAFVVETQRWDLATKLFDETEAEDQWRSSKDKSGMHSTHDAASKPSDKAGVSRSRGGYLQTFIRGLAAASAGAQTEVQKMTAELRAIRQDLEKENPYRAKLVQIMELEVAATASAAKKNYAEAIELMKRATALEEEMSPPSGPPEVIKPSHELFGEILLRAGRPAEAAQQFATALLRQPNRARSLLGAARSAAQGGDQAGAQAAYADFLRVWEKADAQLPELSEARNYMARASAR